MAQELFQTEEKRLLKKRQELISKAMLIWRNSAEDYRCLPEKYEAMLEEKKRRKLPLKNLKVSELKNYPKVPFLDITDGNEAIDYLENLDNEMLEREVGKLEHIMSTNYAYRSMKAWVAEATYILAHPQPSGRKITSLAR